MAWVFVQTLGLLLALVAGTAAADDSAPRVAAPDSAKRVSASAGKIQRYPLIVHPIVQAGGLRGNLAATRTLDGRQQAAVYRVAGGASAAALAKGYRQRLRAAGYKILFDCHNKGCGPRFQRISPGTRQAGDRFAELRATYYLAAHQTVSARDYYAAVQIGATDKGVFVLANYITVEPLKIGAIRVSAQQMAQKIKKQGRVALYGVYFATDSARLKPASKPTLDEIAKLLRDRPDLELIVVGHTDNSGSFGYNIKLSRRRARAVVSALVEDYGIARARLKPWGVGYTAPRATNRTDVGRAMNRRVELVPR